MRSDSNYSSVVRALTLTGIPLFSASYAITCLYGLNFRSLYCAFFVILSCGPLFYCGVKNLPNTRAFKLFVPLVVAFGLIVAMDALSALGKIQIAKIHDLDIIPAQRKLVSPDGYLTAVQVANYYKRKNTPGQVSAYLADSAEDSAARDATLAEVGRLVREIVG